MSRRSINDSSLITQIVVMATRKTIFQPDADSPWNEIIGLILIGIALVIVLALLSYTSNDQSWNSTGLTRGTRNWIGPMGARVADGLYQAFGLAAYMVPFTFFMLGIWEFQQPRAEVKKPETLGVFLVIVAITGFLTMFGPDKPVFLSFYLGGFVGRWLVYGPAIGLSNLLGAVGAFVALSILFMIGLLIATPLSVAGFLMGLQPHEREAGTIPALMERFRIWRLESNQQPVETVRPSQVLKKFDQRRRAGRANSPAGNVRLTVRPNMSGQAAGAVSEAELGAEPNIVNSLAEAEVVIPRPETVSAAPTAPMPAPRTPPPPSLTGGASARKSPRRPPLPTNSLDGADDALDPEDAEGNDEFDNPLGPTQRTIEEMMQTASVKRVDPADGPQKKTKVADLVKSASRNNVSFKLPSTEMLTPPAQRPELEEAELMVRAKQLAEKCSEFNVSGQVKQISPGPVVTTFEFKPDPGVKYSRIVNLVDDLCLGLKAESVRIDRIPGKSTVGIEVPNDNREVIRLREVIESKRFHDSHSKLTLALGKTIDGSNYVADLARMPHLLIAGATGAGKSVALNTILVSLLYKASPDDVKLILVDPKRLELGLYAEIPHLITPIVTDPKRAGYCLKWAVAEMENRYKHLAQFQVRNIDQYNSDVVANAKKKTAGNAPENLEDAPKALPYIVVIIDELADLMMVAARDVEESITRLAQMARAVGIHLVLATQRPSVDVITGLIKANFPSRISFRVSSKIDSRTIIDSNGAEQLLGQGDMLFLPPGTSRLVRVHGAYVDEKEVKRICDHVREQGQPNYDTNIGKSEKELGGDEFTDFKKDEKYDEAVRIVIEMARASTSVLQRRLRIGYGRAASIIDMMEREGIVGPEDGSKPRQVLVKADFLERLDQIREEEGR
jgi:S-DNA-T family DNA segregation ATPase FtsK/SpoIIIE